MLDVELFETAIAEFMSYYKRDLTQNTLAYQSWYSYLSKNLKDFELIPALELAIQTFEYLPPPRKLVETFKGAYDVIAYEEWSRVLLEASNGNSGENLILSPQGEKALRSLGGFKRLALEETMTLHNFVAKEFVNRWIGYKNAIDVGAIAPPEPMLNAGKDEPLLTLEEKPMTKEQMAQLKAKYANKFPFIKKWEFAKNGNGKTATGLIKGGNGSAHSPSIIDEDLEF